MRGSRPRAPVWVRVLVSVLGRACHLSQQALPGLDLDSHDLVADRIEGRVADRIGPGQRVLWTGMVLDRRQRHDPGPEDRVRLTAGGGVAPVRVWAAAWIAVWVTAWIATWGPRTVAVWPPAAVMVVVVGVTVGIVVTTMLAIGASMTLAQKVACETAPRSWRRSEHSPLARARTLSWSAGWSESQDRGWSWTASKIRSRSWYWSKSACRGSKPACQGAPV